MTIDFAFNQGNLMNHVNPGSDILYLVITSDLNCVTPKFLNFNRLSNPVALK